MPMETAAELFCQAIQEEGNITVLTGAGVSAGSGIPTFRGPEGFWTVGSREYHPQEIATFSMFARDPESVWVWYLYRMGMCKKATPNAGHEALARLDSILGDRFTLITQNVDNLHIRAGSSESRTFEIHGNIFKTRCASACSEGIFPLPEDLSPKRRGEALTDKEKRSLRCPSCGGWLRPHVLWFDETYNERYFRFESAIHVAENTRLLITVGTTGATTLPNHITNLVFGNRGLMIDINIADNPFARLATQANRGIYVQGESSRILPKLVQVADCA